MPISLMDQTLGSKTHLFDDRPKTRTYVLAEYMRNPSQYALAPIPWRRCRRSQIGPFSFSFLRLFTNVLQVFQVFILTYDLASRRVYEFLFTKLYPH